MQTAIIVILVCLLIICVVTDLRRRMIYDWVTLPGTLVFLVLHLIVKDISMLEPFAGAAGLGLIALLVAVISKGQFGGGDIKLFMMIGACLGWSIGIWVFMLAFLAAAFFAWPILLLQKLSPKKRKVRELPMAPFIAFSTIFMVSLAY
ncbi:A24 family peptidase [Paenibacillus sp. LHD-38]|uniref:A24 family peptidase n=1 Tax=Paenibacillus sp. LHD-38 TaxID=3072143 RepID=UPI00281078C3|nr:A24 family peptidase [Paenibacillus sp. LHD-38]MDQ8737601.1 A24 family peptidase [Paenibacillus sp. LHD-38]